jgi:hypothetical protein
MRAFQNMRVHLLHEEIADQWTNYRVHILKVIVSASKAR